MMFSLEMGNKSMKPTILALSAVVAVLVCGANQAKADTVYEITGTMTVPGNSSNPGVSETINFSFELDYSQLINGYTPSVVGTPVVTSFGPLGEFSLGAVVPSQGYIGFFSPLLVNGTYPAEMDLMGRFSPVGSGASLVPIVYNGYGGAWLYSCTNGSTGACAPFYTTPGRNIYGTASASVYLVSTPEPGTLCLSVLGVLALCLKRRILAC